MIEKIKKLFWKLACHLTFVRHQWMVTIYNGGMKQYAKCERCDKELFWPQK